MDRGRPPPRSGGAAVPADRLRRPVKVTPIGVAVPPARDAGHLARLRPSGGRDSDGLLAGPPRRIGRGGRQTPPTPRPPNTHGRTGHPGPHDNGRALLRCLDGEHEPPPGVTGGRRPPLCYGAQAQRLHRPPRGKGEPATYHREPPGRFPRRLAAAGEAAHPTVGGDWRLALHPAEPPQRLRPLGRGIPRWSPPSLRPDSHLPPAPMRRLRRTLHYGARHVMPQRGADPPPPQRPGGNMGTALRPGAHPLHNLFKRRWPPALLPNGSGRTPKCVASYDPASRSPWSAPPAAASAPIETRCAVTPPRSGTAARASAFTACNCSAPLPPLSCRLTRPYGAMEKAPDSSHSSLPRRTATRSLRHCCTCEPCYCLTLPTSR